MMARVLSRFDLIGLPCLGLILFLAVFTGAWLWVYRKDGQALYRALSQLPLQDLPPSSPGDR